MTQPAPDLSGYVDLRLYDKTDQEIIDTARSRLQLDIPELVLREGHTEVVLLESIALEESELVVAVNRIPGAVVEAILHLAGVDKDYGNPAFATATVNVGDALGHTIPAGTRMYLTLSDGEVVVFLVEPPDVVIAAGVTSGVVNLVSSTFTAAANGLTPGTPLTLVDPLPWVDSIVLATSVADGRDAESDDEWRDRGVARLSRLSDALVVPRHFVAAAAERSEVGRAIVVDLWSPTSGNDPGEDPGHITVCVLGDDGTPLSGAAKAAIEEDFEDRAAAMLEVHVADITLDMIDIDAQVVRKAGFENAVVQTNVIDTVRAYLNPLNWVTPATGSSTVYFTEMISLIDQVEGVDRVVFVGINGVGADHVITSPTSLPKADAVNISVVAP